MTPTENGDQFLFDYITENYKVRKKINTVIDIARHSRKELFDNLLLHYLKFNQDPENFSKIYWRGNGGTVHNGDTIISELEAAEWREILETVSQSDMGIALIPVQTYLQNTIDNCLKSAKYERERKFLERD